ncbi:MAG: AMP-binding protein [Pseudorhodoplanes sp.]|uniref:AMP-binding protein n=1 Tax=Pseudorhodoplanes sp. TaxID=1934341 RepID=UPI003D1433CE
MQTAFEVIRQAATRSPTRTAIVDVASRRNIDYQSLVSAVVDTASGFCGCGFGNGNRVAVVMPNSMELGIVALALHRAGAVPAMMNPRLKPAEVVALIKEGEISGCVLEHTGALSDLIRQEFGTQFPIVSLNGSGSAAVQFQDLSKFNRTLPDHNPDPEEPGFIFYTSGTTGLPKAVVIPQRATEPRFLFMSTQCGHTHGAHNRICGLMPMYHAIGFYAVFLMALAFNGTFYLFREFVPADVLKSIKQNRLTGLFATPTHLDALTQAIAEADDVSSLEIVIFAGAMMPDQVLAKVRRTFDAKLVNIYGTTEGMNALYMPNPSSGSQFIPGYYSEARVIKIGGGVNDLADVGKEGELILSIKNDAFFTSYYARPETTREKVKDGWYRTSDAAVMCADGTIEVKGRVDDTIISGGENIHPQEVEDVLLAHPAVSDAAVLGIPNERWGQIVVACVVCSTIDSEALEEYFRSSSLADFKRPREYYFFEALPRNATNKIIRRELIDRITKQRR